MEKETFTVYTFIGMYDKWDEITKSMSLHRYLAHFAIGEDNTKEIFESADSRFESEEMSLKDVCKAIAEGTVFFPITVACKKKDVLEYIEKGFNVRFMKFTEYRRLLKAYEG